MELPAEYYAEAEKAIENAIKFMHNTGRWTNKRHTQNNKSILKRLAREADIFNSKAIQNHIMNLKRKKDNINVSDPAKMHLQAIYKNFAEANNIEFKVIQLTHKSPIPLIPSTEDVLTILNSMRHKWYVPFSIMIETATEAEELHQTKRSQIYPQTGSISIIGTKKHNNGTYKLSDKLTENLRQYLATNKNEMPFPESRKLQETWRRYRDARAKQLNKPNLKKIPMKNLRNYAGAIYYTTMGKDPIATKNFMRHKRLEQTMDYLRGLTEFTAKAQKIGKIVATAEEAIELILQGFKEEAVFNQGTPNEKHILTKINI